MANVFDQFDEAPAAPTAPAAEDDLGGAGGGPSELGMKQVAPGIYIPEERALGEYITAGAEAVGTLASSIVAEPISGLAGLVGAAIPGEPGQGARYVEATRNALTLMPESEVGIEVMEDVGTFLIPVGEAFVGAEEFLGDVTLEITGSPAAATVAHAFPTALLELVGLGILKKPSKAAEAAARAQRRVKVEPKGYRILVEETEGGGKWVDSREGPWDSLEEATNFAEAEVGVAYRIEPDVPVDADLAKAFIEPEERTYRELAADLKAKKAKKLAEEVRPDMDIRAAAEELGVDLNPSHYSTNEAFMRVEQALKSRPGSLLAAREAEAITQLGEKADDLIREIGGDIDKVQFNDALKADMQASIKALGKKADEVYDKVRAEIPSATKVRPRASEAYISKRLEDLGGDVSLLSASEKKLHKMLTADRPPSYGALDEIRRNIGHGYKRQGLFKDDATGNLDAVYKALAIDQQAIAAAISKDGGAALAMGRKLVKTRKALEDQAMAIFGKQMRDSVIPKLTRAATAMTKGDVSRFANLMDDLPAAMRTRAAATMLNDLFTLGARQKGSLGQGFATAYRNLNRNKGAKDLIFKYLPKEAQKRFDAIGKVSEGIFRARSLENTSKTARDILAVLEDSSMVEKIYGKIGRPLLYYTGGAFMGMGADVAAVAVKGQAKRVTKADDLLNSPQFERSLNKAMEGKVKEAEIMLKRSKVWQAFRDTLGEGTKAQLLAIGPIAWLTQRREEPAQPANPFDQFPGAAPAQPAVTPPPAPGAMPPNPAMQPPMVGGVTGGQ